jgi:hypothetical protein
MNKMYQSGAPPSTPADPEEARGRLLGHTAGQLGAVGAG